jgi:hypothetical protein
MAPKERFDMVGDPVSVVGPEQEDLVEHDPLTVPEGPASSDFASFKSNRSKRLRITLKPRDMILVKQADGTLTRIPDPVGGRTVQFNMGTYETSDRETIKGLLRSPSLNRDFAIDTTDPTGFWRKNNIVRERQKVTVEFEPIVGAIEDSALVRGTISAASRQGR